LIIAPNLHTDRLPREPKAVKTSGSIPVALMGGIRGESALAADFADR
jgi:hypothetical protein